MEVDSTFYATPSKTTVQGWRNKTPNGFVFAAKVPQVITHEKVLLDCDAEFNEFVQTMDLLGDKLGPLLLQFRYFNRPVFRGVNDFLARLKPFLNNLPKDHQFALEIRNKNWLVPQFMEALRERGVALALIDQSWMTRPAQWLDKLDPITADFTYVRWLGDRKVIEIRTKVWDEVIVDRRAELSEWAEVLRNWAEVLGNVHKRKIHIFAYANNHYAGHGPATVEMFQELWRRQVKTEIMKTKQAPEQGQLFN